MSGSRTARQWDKKAEVHRVFAKIDACKVAQLDAPIHGIPGISALGFGGTLGCTFRLVGNSHCAQVALSNVIRERYGHERVRHTPRWGQKRELCKHGRLSPIDFSALALVMSVRPEQLASILMAAKNVV